MPTPVLPNGLKPEISGYGFDGPGGVTRTAVGGGIGRYGLDWDAGKQPYRVSFVFEGDEFSVWTAFYHHILKNGSIPFDMPLDSGLGTETHTAAIVPGSYTTERLQPDVTKVSFTVEATSTVLALSFAAAQDLVDAFEAAAGMPLMQALRPIISGFAMQGPDGAQESPVQGGAIASRALAWDRGSVFFRVTLLPLDSTEFLTWSAYHLHIIAKGSLAFDMVLDSGFGPMTHTVSMVPGTYSVARVSGARWSVAFTVETESSVYAMSAADAANLIDVFNTTGAGLDELLARIAQFANEDTLVLV